MKQLTKKDLVITSLFFLFLFAATSLALPALVFKNVAYQAMLSGNPVMLVFAYLGYVLMYPIMVLFVAPLHFLSLLGFNPLIGEPLLLLPILTSAVYTSALLFFLTFLNRQEAGQEQRKKL